MEKKMSSYFWCHGPECHEKATTDRVRGSKGSKVLRTRKIKQHHNEYYNVNRAWNYFCSQGCQNDWINANVENIVNQRPITFNRERRFSEQTYHLGERGWLTRDGVDNE